MAAAVVVVVVVVVMGCSRPFRGRAELVCFVADQK
jgi:hypothetical protein